NRDTIRTQAVEYALRFLRQYLYR
ncbi:Competence-damaged protein, partial [Snodgrassella alvi SCGC AB-598-J21]